MYKWQRILDYSKGSWAFTYSAATYQLARISYTEMLDKLAREVCICMLAIIAPDFNTWTTGRKINRRKLSLIFLTTLDVVMINNGQKYTYKKNGFEFIIDVTHASISLVSHCHCHVGDIYTHCGHHAVIIMLTEVSPSGKHVSRTWYPWNMYNWRNAILRGYHGRRT